MSFWNSPCLGVWEPIGKEHQVPVQLLSREILANTEMGEEKWIGVLKSRGEMHAWLRKNWNNHWFLLRSCGWGGVLGNRGYNQ